MSAVVNRRRAQIAKRVLWTIMILIGLSLLALLYSFKTMAQSARKDVLSLEAGMQSEEDMIALLKAEISFLERGDRVADMAAELLSLEPVLYKGDNAVLTIMDIELREEDAMIAHDNRRAQ